MGINVQRLEKLADMLDGYRPGERDPAFDLRNWSPAPIIRREGFLWHRRVECRTAACAVGLACLSKAFEPDGLAYITVEGQLMPTFGGKRNWPAVEAFFGLTHVQVLKLFHYESYVVSVGPGAADEVASRIRELTARSKRAKATRPQKRFAETVERIKAAALEPV